MNWTGAPARLLFAMVLGLLGPQPNFIHVGYKPLAPGLWEIVNYWIVDPLLGRDSASMAWPYDTGLVSQFLQAYALSCVAAFILLTILTWVYRRFVPRKQE